MAQSHGAFQIKLFFSAQNFDVPKQTATRAEKKIIKTPHRIAVECLRIVHKTSNTALAAPRIHLIACRIDNDVYFLYRKRQRQREKATGAQEQKVSEHLLETKINVENNVEHR